MNREATEIQELSQVIWKKKMLQYFTIGNI